MNVKYLDPYKDDKYGKLRGDKSESYFKLIFAETKVYKTDEAYILAGEVAAYQGVTRSFKPELAIEAGLCAVPIYGQEYSIRRKDGEKWVDDKFKPSIFELFLYNWIKRHESTWIDSDKSLTGDFAHIPNGMCANLDDTAMSNLLTTNVNLRECPPTGKLPVYELPKTYGGSRGGGRSYGLSPDEKMLFFKKQLATDIIDSSFTEDMSLLKLIEQMIVENPMESEVTTIYFDCLLGCVK